MAMKLSPPMEKPTKSGAASRIYFDAEADQDLDTHAAALGMNRSNIVCALIRALGGKSPRTGEEKVHERLKKVFGRDHMRAFLRGVAEAIGSRATAIGKPDHLDQSNFIPSMWKAGKSLAIVAFFHPNQENVGELFTHAISAKNMTGAKKVLIVCPSAETVPSIARETLSEAGIVFVSVTHLQTELNRLLA